eukprot:1366788-Amorphochlora_amoeboformis.AAC.3
MAFKRERNGVLFCGVACLAATLLIVLRYSGPASSTLELSAPAMRSAGHLARIPAALSNPGLRGVQFTSGVPQSLRRSVPNRSGGFSSLQRCSSNVGVNAAGDEEYVVDRNYNVVITGSTKGVGYALAEKFLEAGDSVVICSNEPQSVQDEVILQPNLLTNALSSNQHIKNPP